MRLMELRAELAGYQDILSRIPSDSGDPEDTLTRAIYMSIVKECSENITALEAAQPLDPKVSVPLPGSLEETIVPDIVDQEICPGQLQRVPCSDEVSTRSNVRAVVRRPPEDA